MTVKIEDTSVTQQKFLEILQRSFEIPSDEQDVIFDDLLKCFHEAYQSSEIAMIPTNFKIPDSFPTYDDAFLCLDVGGSTIRIAVVSIKDMKIEVMKQEEWLLKEDQKLINFEFFESLVTRAILLIESLQHVTNMDREISNVGVTWSFPLNSSNEILKMGKGFTISSEISNLSISELIKMSFDKLHFGKVDKVTIINDSVAVNLSNLLNEDVKSDISLIVGTGLNSCIQHNNELINTELGFFGKLSKPNAYDLKLNSGWINPQKPHLKQLSDDNLFQPLEFLCSSRYITELFRLIVVDLIELNILSITELPEPFQNRYETHGSLITILEDIKDIICVQKSLSDEFNLDLTKTDIRFLNKIISVILERSSIFLSLGIKALDRFITSSPYDEKKLINVTFIGSFLSHSGLYQKKIIEHSNGTIKLNHVDNSSIIGAGVAAFLNI
jgi:hexokinase